MTNFRRPYFSKDCAEFWHRWHISLSTWFKDYVYIPLGGNRVNKLRKNLNLIITFLVSGLWHGANWTFVIWGGLNGLLQVMTGMFKIKSNTKFLNFIKIIWTFILIDITWIFFRANSLSDAGIIIKKIFLSFDSNSIFLGDGGLLYSLLGIIILLSKDIYDEIYPNIPTIENKFSQYLWYTFLTLLIITIGVFDGSQFIYFQF